MRAKVPLIRAIRTTVGFIEQVPGIEPRSSDWKSEVITVIRYLLLVLGAGIEPARAMPTGF